MSALGWEVQGRRQHFQGIADFSNTRSNNAFLPKQHSKSYSVCNVVTTTTNTLSQGWKLSP